MKNFQEEDQILFEAIEAYRNGDGGKATLIYESTKKYTYKIVHQEVERFKSQGVLTGDAISITEDVMQELYIDFFNKIANFRNEDPKSIFKWISVVAHRMLLTYVKENKMEVLQFAKDEDYREDNDIWDSSEINDTDMESHHELLPEVALEDKEFQQLILDFIQSLPEAQAQTVLLHFRGGMKYQEIADEMGVSLITVKTRMKKAKDSLEKIINRYEKKTGTKLHSVSILPLLWLLYRMASEDTTVPVAVDAAVTGSVVGASGAGIGGATTAGSIGTIGATTATKAISTRVLVAIVSTAVVIGGVAVGSQLIDKKQETTIEQGDSEDKELDNKQDNEGSDDTSSKGDKDTSNTNDEGNSETNQNETAGDNNGSDTNNTGSDNNVTQEGNGTGNNTNGTDSNTASGNEDSGNGSGNEGTGGSENNTGSGNDSGNEDQGESTAAKGTKENPYRIGEKIVVSEDIVYNPSESDRTDIFHLEFTVTDFIPMKEALALKGIEYAPQTLLEAVQATIKIVSENTVPNEKTPIVLTLVSEGSHSFSHSGMLYTENDGRYSLITDFSGNKEHDINVFCSYSSESIVWTYLEIKYYTSDGTMNKIYVKLE